MRNRLILVAALVSVLSPTATPCPSGTPCAAAPARAETVAKDTPAEKAQTETPPSAEPTAGVGAVAAKTQAALPDAPFGLTWLMSRTEVLDLGADLGPVFTSEFGDSTVATGLPKELPDLHYAVLSFGYDDRLIRVVAVSEGNEQDRTAARVTARYNELASLLTERYQSVKSETHIDEHYDADRTALGFHSKKNSMYTELRDDDLRIELSVFAVAHRTHWRLIFEYLPAMREIENRRKRLDEKAL